MRRLVALAVFIVCPLLASAADWQVIAETKLGELKLDKTSVSKEGKLTKAVLVYKFKDLQKLAFAPFPVFNLRQDDVIVDCANPMLGLASSQFFDDAKLVNTSTLKSADVKFNPPAPDSMADKVVKAVCAAAPTGKP
jgi:hypothetical protein